MLGLRSAWGARNLWRNQNHLEAVGRIKAIRCAPAIWALRYHSRNFSLRCHLNLIMEYQQHIVTFDSGSLDHIYIYTYIYIYIYIYLSIYLSIYVFIYFISISVSGSRISWASHCISQHFAATARCLHSFSLGQSCQAGSQARKTSLDLFATNYMQRSMEWCTSAKLSPGTKCPVSCCWTSQVLQM